MAQGLQTVAGVGSLVSEASARESFDFERFRVGQALPHHAIDIDIRTNSVYSVLYMYYTSIIYLCIICVNVHTFIYLEGISGLPSKVLKALSHTQKGVSLNFGQVLGFRRCFCQANWVTLVPLGSDFRPRRAARNEVGARDL